MKKPQNLLFYLPLHGSWGSKKLVLSALLIPQRTLGEVGVKEGTFSERTGRVWHQCSRPRFVIYFYGSGSFHQQAKKWRKALISTVWWLFYDFLSFKKVANVPSKRNKHKNLLRKFFFLASWWSLTKIAGSGPVSQSYVSEDPDPDQNVTDPEHWCAAYRYLLGACLRLEPWRWPLRKGKWLLSNLSSMQSSTMSYIGGTFK